jgi:hypothetical protein
MIVNRFCLIWLMGLLLSPCSGLAAPPQSGFIEGSLSYPSEFIPDDITICAENLVTQKIYCTSKHLKGKKYQYKVGYKLTLPPGEYHVYAQLPDPAKWGSTFSKNYRAYYSDFVKCGQTTECKSHAPIVVQVKSGETVSGIDPMDWYK